MELVPLSGEAKPASTPKVVKTKEASTGAQLETKRGSSCLGKDCANSFGSELVEKRNHKPTKGWLEIDIRTRTHLSFPNFQIGNFFNNNQPTPCFLEGCTCWFSIGDPSWVQPGWVLEMTPSAACILGMTSPSPKAARTLPSIRPSTRPCCITWVTRLVSRHQWFPS